jgi:hypothetical protein
MTMPNDSTTVITTRGETTSRDEPVVREQPVARQQPLSTADFASAGTAVDRQTADRAEPSPRPGLFPGGEAQSFQSRWSEIQIGFVDEPRRSVEQADSLVAEVMQRLAQVFADERARLEQQWDRGEDTDTEALRQALRRYRSFFDRLLSL